MATDLLTGQAVKTTTTPNSKTVIFLLSNGKYQGLVIYKGASALTQEADSIKEASDFAYFLLFTLSG